MFWRKNEITETTKTETTKGDLLCELAKEEAKLSMMKELLKGADGCPADWATTIINISGRVGELKAKIKLIEAKEQQ